MISKSIDLTLRSLFASDYDENLMFDSEQRHFRESSIKHHHGKVLTGRPKKYIDLERIFHGIRTDIVRILGKDESSTPLGDWEQSHIDMLGKPPKYMPLYGMCAYLVDATYYTCECCGVELNMLNSKSNHTICEPCDSSYRDKPMAL